MQRFWVSPQQPASWRSVQPDAVNSRGVIVAITVLWAVLSSSFAQPGGWSYSSQPPELHAPTFAAALIATLNEQIEQRGVVVPPDDVAAQIVARVSINTRAIAADLLAAGDRAGVEGSAALVAGMRLARSCDAIDALLAPLTVDAAADDASIDEEQRAQALMWLRRFNDAAAALRAQPRTFDQRELDELLPETFAPLVEAMISLGHGAVVTHWIDAAAVTGNADAEEAAPARLPDDAPATLENRIAAMRNRVESSSLPPQTIEVISQMLDYLERGQQFVELRPRVEALWGTIDRLLDFADALHAAAWLTELEKGSYFARLHEAVTHLAEPASRPMADRLILQLEASHAAIDRMNALAEHRVDLRPLKAAFMAIDAPRADAKQDTDAEHDSRIALQQLAAVLSCMVDYRELDPARLPRDLQRTGNELDKMYRAVEKSLVTQLQTVAAGDSWNADSAMENLLAQQAQLLSDLQRIRRVPAWLDAMVMIDPRSRPALTRHLSRFFESLVNPARRSDAIATLDQFERELNWFAKLPFEDELRSGDAAAIQATGGLHEELAQLITEQRREWAKSWSAGHVDLTASERMKLLYRLAQLMEDVAIIVRQQDAAVELDRWAGWHLPMDMVIRPWVDVSARLKLATSAALQGDDAALALQLEQINRDAPLVKLVGRLSNQLGDALESLPSGGVGALGLLVHPPHEDAWLVEHRQVFADLCRYVLECEHLRASARDDEAAVVNQYVNLLADRLFAVISP